MKNYFCGSRGLKLDTYLSSFQLLVSLGERQEKRNGEIVTRESKREKEIERQNRRKTKIDRKGGTRDEETEKSRQKER